MTDDPTTEIVLRCGCGRTYTAGAFAELPVVGEMEDGVVHIELRNCPCGSTHSQEMKK